MSLGRLDLMGRTRASGERIATFGIDGGTTGHHYSFQVATHLRTEAHNDAPLLDYKDACYRRWRLVLLLLHQRPRALIRLNDETDVLHQYSLHRLMGHRLLGAHAVAGGLELVYILRATKCLPTSLGRMCAETA